MNHLSALEFSPSLEREVELIEHYIAQQVATEDPIQILEAGCGQRWTLRLDGIRYFLTGVDSDPHALDIRKNIRQDLDQAVVGDLRTVRLDPGKFDVIYSSFVLEHIQGAEGVLESFVRWLKPGGIIIIRIPDPDSVQGFITRITPHWFHIFYYRYVLGYKNAGRPGYAPYPTYYEPVVSRAGLRRFCEKNNVTIKVELGDAYYRPGQGAVQRVISAIKRTVKTISLGKFSDRHTNLLYILQLDKQ